MQFLDSCYTIGLTPTEHRSRSLTRQRIEHFLAGVEKRAYRMALVTMRDRDDALDAVQEAMMQLVSKYQHKQEEEWPRLFFRILHNKMMDMHRKRKLQARFGSWFGSSQNVEEDSFPDPIEQAEGERTLQPDVVQERRQNIAILESAIRALPPRQQQAFMLRCWEGFNTAEAAATMGCSEGSVKTHYSRAMHALQQSLGVSYE